MLSVTSAQPKPRAKPPSYEELEEEVAYLRGLLEPDDFDWRRGLGLHRAEARVLWVLLHRKLATSEALCHTLTCRGVKAYDYKDWRLAVRAQICLLRRKLTKRFGFSRPCIVSVNRVGYEMDPEYGTMLREEIAKLSET